VRSGEVAGDADRLFGGEGNDRLVGGSGADVLVGGPGNDRFGYGRNTDRGDDIFGFQLGQDVIDLSSVLTGFTPGQSNPAGFLQVAATSLPGDDDEPDTPGFNLSVDFDGGGNNFVQFARVFGAGSNVTVDQLVSTDSVDLVPG
jgi:Ca2+-binding RTX toxin-like protein